jgi:acyl carrier protein
MTNEEKIISIKSILVELFQNTYDIDPDTNFADIGIDSLGIVDLQLACEDRLNLTIENPYETIHSVGDLMAIMK